MSLFNISPINITTHYITTSPLTKKSIQIFGNVAEGVFALVKINVPTPPAFLSCNA